jgi:hypothetical protein
LGVVIAIIILINLKNKEIKDKKTISPQITPTVTMMNVKTQGLDIIEPVSETTVNSKSITIKGRAAKDTLIVLQSATTEKVYKTVSEDFSIDFPLSLGENFIDITSYKDKTSEEKSIKVYYIEE